MPTGARHWEGQIVRRNRNRLGTDDPVQNRACALYGYWHGAAEPYVQRLARLSLLFSFPNLMSFCRAHPSDTKGMLQMSRLVICRAEASVQISFPGGLHEGA